MMEVPAASGGARRERDAPDRLTILRTKGLPATKTIAYGPDGLPAIVSSYGNAKRFAIRQATVSDLASLAAALDRVRWDEFVIRGEPLPGVDWRDTLRRLHPEPVTGQAPTFREEPRRWLLLDLDDLLGPYRFDPLDGELAAAFARSTLPGQFHPVSCWWQLTSSAGIAPGVRIRLAVWLARPVGRAELARWLAAAPVDHAVFGPVQPIYVAPPILRGVPDPVPMRSGVLLDVDDAVPVPELLEPETPPPPRPLAPERREGSGRYALAALAREAAAIAAAPVGGRHAALNRAGFALARFVRSGELTAVEVVAELLQAARRAGIKDPDTELRRFLRGGLHAGLARAGTAA